MTARGARGVAKLAFVVAPRSAAVRPETDTNSRRRRRVCRPRWDGQCARDECGFDACGLYVAKGGAEKIFDQSLVPRLEKARPHPCPLPQERGNSRQMV